VDVSVPRWLLHTIVVLVVLSWVPLAIIVRARTVTTNEPRIHLVQDMDNQPKLKAQTRNPLFADHRAMRPPVPGTVARNELRADDALYRGTANGEWVTAIPIELTAAMLARGRERFDVYCSPCHGLAGYGDGMVAKRAQELAEGTWIPPSSFHTDVVRDRPAGDLFNTISHGIRNMPAYGPQIGVRDRWAIVAFLRALQRSQRASIEDVPPELRSQLR
jgi:mono/diheme cytochrome c family protein